MSKEISIVGATIDLDGYYTIVLSNEETVYGLARDISSMLVTAGLSSMCPDDLESGGLTPEEADTVMHYW